MECYKLNIKSLQSLIKDKASSVIEKIIADNFIEDENKLILWNNRFWFNMKEVRLFIEPIVREYGIKMVISPSRIILSILN